MFGRELASGRPAAAQSRAVPARALIAIVCCWTALAAPAGAQASAAGAAVHQARMELAHGVHELPDGSNDSPGIARYRSAVLWAGGPAPWCMYFASWVRARAGAALGQDGSGIGSVPAAEAWARREGLWSTVPSKGAVMVMRSRGHAGVVESVTGPWVVTIEGNHSNRVARAWHSRRDAAGYVAVRRAPPSAELDLAP